MAPVERKELHGASSFALLPFVCNTPTASKNVPRREPCESFMKTLKHEEVHRTECRNFHRRKSAGVASRRSSTQSESICEETSVGAPETVAKNRAINSANTQLWQLPLLCMDEPRRLTDSLNVFANLVDASDAAPTVAFLATSRNCKRNTKRRTQ